jgi:ABC-2 type transport system ATP-binding protein
MLSEPKVLILDEPTEGLDPYQKLKLREVLQDYGKKNIVLISTHIMEEVEAMATRVLMIKKGKLICDSTPADLKKITSQNKIEESFYTIVGDIKGDK